jgi:hypothetical protein
VFRLPLVHAPPMLAPSHWTVKLEYDYLTQSNWTRLRFPRCLNRDVQMIKAGINYKFEAGVDPASRCRSILVTPAEDENLQKQSQNPVADLVSVPFQSNTNFNTGPFNRTQEVLNIPPVVPLHINNDWNLSRAHRTVDQPAQSTVRQ